MAPLLYLIAFISTITAACSAEIVALRAAPNAEVRGLVNRPESSSNYRFVPPISESSDPDLSNDAELLDIVLLASVDGRFHALSRTSGQPLWSMSSYSSVSFPPTLAPLVRTSHVDIDPEDDSPDQELYVIEPQSGDIYVMATPQSPLRRFPLSMSELVENSPYSFLGEEDYRWFIGRKETSLLLIELETGKVKATVTSECPWDPFEVLHDNKDSEVDLDELEGSKPAKQTPTSTEVFIGRTDYHVSIYTGRNSPFATKAPVQNLSFSTYGPNNHDSVLQLMYKRTQDNAYIHSLPRGDIISFKAKDGGDSARSNDEPQPLWGHTFSKPIVAIFDVLRKSSTTHSHSPQTFVLLQPRPRLQDVIPNLSADTAKPLDLYSAYVGMVEETGSLFAMTTARFPLLAFGGAGPRPSDLNFLDAPDNSKEEQFDELDAVTRARKQKEQREKERMAREIQYSEKCKVGAGGDRRCLTGVRKLDSGDGDEPESRMTRFLDGTPSDSRPMLPGLSRTLEGAANGTTMGQNGTDIDNPLLRSKEGRYGVYHAVVIAVLFVVSLWLTIRMMGSKDAKNGRIVGEENKKEEIVSRTGDLMKMNTQVPPEITAPVLTTSDSTNELPRDAPPDAISHISNRPQEDAEDSDKEAEGEGEGDAVLISGKKKVRRGKRGKKKKMGLILAGGEEGKEKIANGSAGKIDVEDAKPLPLLAPEVTPAPKPAAVPPSLVVSDTVLGFGSHGTVVFQGSFQGRAVAVKRLLEDFVTLASREVDILQESDDHPNVIRYYYQEAHANFRYIALELCPASLADIIESPDKEHWRDIAIAFDPKRAIRQITSGLRHLHGLKLVHRDIKPQNILVSRAKAGRNKHGRDEGHRMLISDFGLCKKLDVDQTSFLPTAHGALAAGTVGWRAPEILRGEVKLDEVGDDSSLSSRGSVSTPTMASGAGKPTRLTKSVDIFALGCLFYYTLTNGGHPFGDRFEREVNILKNAKSLEGLERFGEEGAEATNLIGSMLHPEAHERPDTTTCLLHPFFWDPGRRLNFLQDASDRFEIMCRDPKDPKLLSLEQDAIDIVGNDWHSRLDKTFIENLGKFRKYDGRSVQDLLRALRNKKNHYQDLPDHVKRHLGPMPEGFLLYFTQRYPKLFLHVHSVIADTGLCNEPMFRSYFEVIE